MTNMTLPIPHLGCCICSAKACLQSARYYSETKFWTFPRANCQTADCMVSTHSSFVCIRSKFVYFEYARFFGNGVVQLWQIEA